ncbi:MAG: dienelactone hydrolase family protein [Chloroflexi bacterium]|nr:dienelactone hydrolase family protein [Chloroflexota bacterium]
MDYLQYYSVQEFADHYKRGWLSRRELLRRVLYITGGVASTASVLSLLGCGGSAAAPTASGAANSPAPALARPDVSSAGSPSLAASASASAKPAAATNAAPSAAASTVTSPPPSASAGASSSPSAAAKPSASGSIAASPVGPTPSVGSVPASDRNLSAVPNAKSPLSVAPNDPSLDTRDVVFSGNGANLIVYEARPANASGPLPVMLVVEQNMGLNEHIKDVTRRWAKQGYIAAALDELSRQGGTAAVNPSQIASLVSGTQPAATFVGDYKAMVAYYSAQQGVKPAFGMNGFCLGGGIVWLAAEGIPQLKAAVPFYGAAPPIDQVPNIKAAIYAVYSDDPKDFANNGRDPLIQALKAANVTFDYKAYPGTMHAFNDDTQQAYNQTQALAAWQDATTWMAKYVKG